MKEDERRFLRILEDILDVEIAPRHREREPLPDWLDHNPYERPLDHARLRQLLGDEQYAKLAAWDAEMVRLERSARSARGEAVFEAVTPSEPAEVSTEPPASNRVAAPSEGVPPPTPVHEV